MKKLFFVLYACLCVGLWSCSNDDEPTVPAKQEVAVSFEDKLTEPNTSPARGGFLRVLKSAYCSFVGNLGYKSSKHHLIIRKKTLSELPSAIKVYVISFITQKSFGSMMLS